MSIDQQLLELKSKNEKLNNLKVENQTKLSLLEKEKEELLKECALLGIEPNTIEQVLKDEETSLQSEVTSLEQEISKIFNDLNAI